MDINGDETDTKKITCSTIDNRQTLICQSEMCFSFTVQLYFRLCSSQNVEIYRIGYRIYGSEKI